MRIITGSLILVLLVMPRAIAAEVPQAPLKKLEGSWKVIVVERDGEKLSAEKIKAITITIAGDQLTIKDDRSSDTATIKTDPSKKPATIDFQTSNSEKQAQGIYEWSGEQLKMCWSKAGGARPKEFASKTGTGTVLFVLEREK